MLIVLLLGLLLVAAAVALLAAYHGGPVEARFAPQPVRVERRRRH